MTNPIQQPLARLCRCVVTLVALAGILTGCKSFDRIQRLEPSVYQRSRSDALARVPLQKDGTVDPVALQNLVIQVTDRQVYAFADHLKTLLRGRAASKRMAREASATLQVLTAAAAASLIAVDGGATQAATILAGTSAIIPNLQNIFAAGEKSLAFSEAVAMVESAEVRYLSTLSSNEGVIPNRQLTQGGIQFFEEVTAALRVLDAAIASHIPSVQDLELAQGMRLSLLKLSRYHWQVPAGTGAGSSTSSISTTDGTAIEAVSSDNEGVVTATLDSNQPSKVTLTSHRAGKAKVGVFGANGLMSSVTVEVPLVLTINGQIVEGPLPVLVPGQTLSLVSPNSTSLSLKLSTGANYYSATRESNTIQFAHAGESVPQGQSVQVPLVIVNENNATASLTLTVQGAE